MVKSTLVKKTKANVLKEEAYELKEKTTEELQFSKDPAIEKLRSALRGAKPAQRKILQKQIQSTYGNAVLKRVMSEKPLKKSEEDLASQGFSSPSQTYPHKDAVEKALGIDLTGVKAHVGKEASVACQDMSAEAYTYKGEVAFHGSTPSFSTATHEAVHLAQESGIDLSGVGASGTTDALEREAYSIEKEVAGGTRLGKKKKQEEAVSKKRIDPLKKVMTLKKKESAEVEKALPSGKVQKSRVLKGWNPLKWGEEVGGVLKLIEQLTNKKTKKLTQDEFTRVVGAYKQLNFLQKYSASSAIVSRFGILDQAIRSENFGIYNELE